MKTPWDKTNGFSVFLSFRHLIGRVCTRPLAPCSRLLLRPLSARLASLLLAVSLSAVSTASSVSLCCFEKCARDTSKQVKRRRPHGGATIREGCVFRPLLSRQTLVWSVTQRIQALILTTCKRTQQFQSGSFACQPALSNPSVDKLS